MEQLPPLTFKEPGFPNFKSIKNGPSILELPGEDKLELEGDFDTTDTTDDRLRFVGFAKNGNLVEVFFDILDTGPLIDEVQIEQEVVYKYKAPTIH